MLVVVSATVVNTRAGKKMEKKNSLVSFGDFHLFLLSYFFLPRSTLLTINLLQLHSSIVALVRHDLFPTFVVYICLSRSAHIL